MTTRTRSLPVASATVETRSADQTRDFAAKLATAARPGDRVALLGTLGAGKTQFAKGFAFGLGVEEIVNSPSFTLMAEYEGRLPLFHQDLYRLTDAAEVLGGGLVDDRQEDGVTLIEWGERLPSALDPRRVLVRFQVGNGDQRLITVEAMGSEGARYVGAARTWSAP